MVMASWGLVVCAGWSEKETDFALFCFLRVSVTSRCFRCVDVQARGSGSSGSGSNSSSNKTSSPDDDQVIGPSTLAAACVPAAFCACMSVYFWHLDVLWKRSGFSKRE
jgi:hypothetical protein